MPPNPIDRVHELLGYFDTAMFVTHGEGGQHHARPMALAGLDANCDLWFFTASSSALAHEIETDQQALVVFQDEHSRYLSLSGTAQLVIDRNKASDLWDDKFETWFPRGLEDPGLLLIRVHTHAVEYWDHVGATGIKYMAEAARAMMHGAHPHGESERHGKVMLE